MTFSMVARCPRTGQFGVAACTYMMGVGKLVSYAEAGVGAVATQAFVNPYYGLDGLHMMKADTDAHTALKNLRENDPRDEKRQVAMIDDHGNVTAWSGSEIAEWAGHLIGSYFSAQGNRLVGPETLDETVKGFLEHEERELAERFLLALEAGEATGADRKGARSAAITVMDSEEYPLWDLRVDEAADPVKALRQLYHHFETHLIPNIKKMPTRSDPAGQLMNDDEALG